MGFLTGTEFSKLNFIISYLATWTKTEFHSKMLKSGELIISTDSLKSIHKNSTWDNKVHQQFFQNMFSDNLVWSLYILETQHFKP